MEIDNVWTYVGAVIRATDRVLLYGPSGTGKTRIAADTASSDGIPHANITLTPETSAADLWGHPWIGDGGAMRWNFPAPIRLFRDGGLLTLNEISECGADGLGAMLAICDDKAVAKITLPNGETVARNNNFKVVGTMNGELSDLPEALISRFSARINIDEVNPEALQLLPDYLRSAAAGFSCHTDPEQRISLRQFFCFAELIAAGIPDTIAAKCTFGNRGESLLHDLQTARASAENASQVVAPNEAI